MARSHSGVAPPAQRDIDDIVAAVRASGRDALFEHEVYAVLASAGFEVPRHFVWSGDPAEAPEGALAAFLDALPARRVVLKIVSSQILHKSDVGGLAFAERTVDAVRATAVGLWADVSARAPGAERAGILVSEMLSSMGGSPASETLVSARLDPAFGPVLVLGLGGVLTEWFGALSDGRSTLILRPGRVRETLVRAADRLPAMGLLFRQSRLHAKPPLDLERTAERLEALGRAAELFAELEVNPLLTTPDARWVAVDGKARLAGPAPVPRSSPPLAKIAKL
ncbi:MAG TPA: acetate--CoA ligase family protein, partial [Vicinamibacteria bacterium]|nr:acetate--CoA ligase family protein [Vicinamibacteria bacterium]